MAEARTAAQLALALGRGDAAAADELSPMIYGELRGLANRYLGRMAPGGAHTLQPTALVHEAWLKLVDDAEGDARSRTHFFSVAALAMRQVLIDHARGKGREKRGGDWQRVTLSDAADAREGDELDLLELEQALAKYERLDERAARVVRMRFYAGMTTEAVAEALGVSERTVRNDWSMARAWLRLELCPDEPG